MKRTSPDHGRRKRRTIPRTSATKAGTRLTRRGRGRKRQSADSRKEKLTRRSRNPFELPRRGPARLQQRLSRRRARNEKNAASRRRSRQSLPRLRRSRYPKEPPVPSSVTGSAPRPRDSDRYNVDATTKATTGHHDVLLADGVDNRVERTTQDFEALCRPQPKRRRMRQTGLRPPAAKAARRHPASAGPKVLLADIYAIYTSRPAERGASHRLVRLFDPAEGAGTANIDGPQALPYKPRKIARRPK